MTVGWQTSGAYGALLWPLPSSYCPFTHVEDDKKIASNLRQNSSYNDKLMIQLLIIFYLNLVSM